jgi:hypothetical protein
MIVGKAGQSECWQPKEHSYSEIKRPGVRIARAFPFYLFLTHNNRRHRANPACVYFTPTKQTTPRPNPRRPAAFILHNIQERLGTETEVTVRTPQAPDAQE